MATQDPPLKTLTYIPNNSLKIKDRDGKWFERIAPNTAKRVCREIIRQNYDPITIQRCKSSWGTWNQVAASPKRISTLFQRMVLGLERIVNYLSLSSGVPRPLNPLLILQEMYSELRKAGVTKGKWLPFCGMMLTLPGFGVGGATFVRENTEESDVFGDHLGAYREPQGNLGMHTDESEPLSVMVANLNAFITGKKKVRYQKAIHFLKSLRSGTVTLFEKDLVTNEIRSLSLKRYRDWLEWTKEIVDSRPQQKAHQDFSNKLEKGGKVDWPTDLVSPERFEEFRKQCGGDYMYLIVSSTPPPSMAPDFVHGAAHKLEQEWIYQQVNSGPPKNTGKRPTAYEKKYLDGKVCDRWRITAFATRATENGFLGRPEVKVYADYRMLQAKIERIVVENVIEGPEAVRAALELNLASLELEHPSNIMGGKSHKYFTRRVVKLVAAQPTIGQMRATLWQYNELEVPLDFDPGRDIPVYQEREKNTERNDTICGQDVVSHFRCTLLSEEEQIMTNAM